MPDHSPTRLLVRAAKVLTLDPQRPVIDDGAVLTSGESITAVGSYAELREASAGAREMGGPSFWLLPGFVNAHYHNWRTFSMGATPDGPLEQFMLRMSGFEVPSELEAEFSYLNTIVSAIQLVRSGVACTVDMPYATNHAPILNAYHALGLDLIYAPTIRTQLGYVYADDAEFLATVPADLRARVEGRGLGLTGSYLDPERYWQDWLTLKEAHGERVQFVIAPDGPEWCSETQLKLWRDRADREAACLHLHNSESPMEMQWALKTRGQTMTEYLASIGFLGPTVSCGHGVWYTQHDIELLAAAGVTTVHCPSSNLRLSNGIAPVADYLAGGMHVAIGTDGQGFSDTSDYLEELRLADLLQRTPGLSTRSLPARTLLEMATVHGARAFGRAKTGVMQPGHSANLTLLDAAAMTRPYAWPGHDPHRVILQKARAAHVDTVISRGRILLEGGRITTVDEDDIESRLRALYTEIWAAQSPQRQAILDALEPHVMRFYDHWADIGVASRYSYNRT